MSNAVYASYSVSVSIAANVASKIVKVDVIARAGVNQLDARTFANKSLDIPGLTSHRLGAITSVLSDSLQNEKTAEEMKHS